MTNPALSQAPGGAAVAPSPRRGQLALALQEVLTATVRLRANRQVAADADSFRRHVKQVLSAAEADARRAGYADEEIRLALYAVVAFLDESVLSSTQAMFAEWPRKPLQEEIFGGHLGGELFFQNVQGLIARPDSEDLADLLEVHQLCMLLGFHGRYSASDRGELQMLVQRVEEKMQRIRGPRGEISPSWRPPTGDIPTAGSDVWLKRLVYATAGVLALAVVLLLVFHFSLSSGLTELRALVPPVR